MQRSHFFFLNLISTKNPSSDKSVFSNFEGISSLIYSRMPPLFAFLSNPLNEIVLKEKKNQFFVSDIKSTSMLLLIICCRDSNLFLKEFMFSCAKISLLMFSRRMFSKALWGSWRAPLLRYDGISFGSFKM